MGMGSCWLSVHTAAAAPWARSPATLKPTADQVLLNGINRFVIHESAHQPLVGKAPGLTLGPFGEWFNRKSCKAVVEVSDTIGGPAKVKLISVPIDDDEGDD
jgi:alpha-L-rhamnosidase